MGVIPALVRADLRMASAQFGTDPDGSGGGAHNGTSVAWAPPVRQISLSYEVEHALRAALTRSAEITPPPPRPATAASNAPPRGGGPHGASRAQLPVAQHRAP